MHLNSITEIWFLGFRKIWSFRKGQKYWNDWKTWFNSEAVSWRCTVKKMLQIYVAIFTGKHLCQSLFLINLQAEAYNFIRKEALPQVFSSEFCKISKNTFFKEYLRTTASGKTNYVNLASWNHNVFQGQTILTHFSLGNNPYPYAYMMPEMLFLWLF